MHICYIAKLFETLTLTIELRRGFGLEFPTNIINQPVQCYSYLFQSPLRYFVGVKGRNYTAGLAM